MLCRQKMQVVNNENKQGSWVNSSWKINKKMQCVKAWKWGCMWRGRFSTFVDGTKNFPQLGFEPQHFEKFRHLPNFVDITALLSPWCHFHFASKFGNLLSKFQEKFWHNCDDNVSILSKFDGSTKLFQHSHLSTWQWRLSCQGLSHQTSNSCNCIRVKNMDSWSNSDPWGPYGDEKPSCLHYVVR